MKTNHLIFLVLCIGLIGFVSARAGVVNTDVTVSYNAQNCTTSCNNYTNSTGNFSSCNSNCVGILTIKGENLLQEIIINNNSFAKIYSNNVIRELGNDSDITILANELVSWRQIQDKYNLCLDSNRNVSTKLIMLEDDVGYKQNYTNCDADRISLQQQLYNQQSNISVTNSQLEREKSSKITYLIIGLISGFAIFKFVLPKINGTKEAKDPSHEFPPNAGYK